LCLPLARSASTILRMKFEIDAGEAAGWDELLIASLSMSL